MQRNLLVALVLALVTAFGVGAWWFLRAVPAENRTLVEPVGPGVAPDAPAAPRAEELEAVTRQADGSLGAIGSLPTTVAFPLEVTLDLLVPRDVPRAPGAPPLGSGSNATMRGTILGIDGKPVRAEVEFVAGTNQGRVLYCDSTGAFGATNLQPGISVVRVTGPGIEGSLREVRLRQQRESLLNVTYQRPSRVAGTVFDHENHVLADAVVTVDGQRVVTDQVGVFEVPAVAAGEVLVTVEKPGFAALRQTVTLAMASKVEKDKLLFRLRRAARLQVEVVDRVNPGEQALLFVLPADPAAQRVFPWQMVNPTRVWPGGVATIEDLPGGPVNAFLFHAGATAKPAIANVILAPGETSTLQFHLDAAPVVQGVVTDGGAPVAKARVRLEAPDRTEANLSLFGQSNYLYFESDVFPNLPPAVQEVSTNERGEYTLTANEGIAKARYLTATSPDGRRVAHAVVEPGDLRVDLALAPVPPGRGELRLVLPGRHQPLPVRIVRNGEGAEPQLLSPGRDLRVEGLATGTWLVTVTWQGAPLLDHAQLEIDGELTRELTLPEGAIVGQDAETWMRVQRGSTPR